MALMGSVDSLLNDVRRVMGEEVVMRLKSAIETEHSRNRFELQILQAELSRELVDRTANQARIVDRFRFLLERRVGLADLAVFYQVNQ